MPDGEFSPSDAIFMLLDEAREAKKPEFLFGILWLLFADEMDEKLSF